MAAAPDPLFEEAAELTQVQSFAQIIKARDLSVQEFTKVGCKFYAPTADEKKRWSDACGEQRKEWDDIKKELAGSLDNFEKLKKAANTKGKLTVAS